MSDLSRHIRDIPDFPKQGILFRDITPLLQNPAAFAEALEALAGPYRDGRIDMVAGIESRGFIFGAALARLLNVGFVPIRKPGKLPAEKVREEYQLEYGTDAVEVHRDAVKLGQRVLMVDDLLATGGTMAASCALIERIGGRVAGVAFLIELTFLNGRGKLKGREIHAVIRY
ncbi:MAG: adenine phosphoribosyltransferase [Candidatus Handelsmanbacteria bacterium RIFCSPLOWO2_12_FULL_64_10]|uniref:Adenine phosphoribosyltransferase n=1 Tax=Handelsmanbacteria sp. (strain RIFCSPLOWO2_12_FULL_64_10) TaxID=1817868 RepID=A0A1F6C3B9_HANXR|nr:MAG: adenine phosphoribosyltransferase [Candidatus Handelsmanbacteria bacterium RIFCSPLOWO2_12_FULL_64_10]